MESVGNGIVEEGGHSEEPFRDKVDSFHVHFELQIIPEIPLFLVSLGAFVTERTHNSFFTIHGVIQVFLFIIPGIPAPLGNLFLPILKGKLFLPEIYHLILIVSSG